MDLVFEPYDSLSTEISDPLHLGFGIGCYTKNYDGSFVPYTPNQGNDALKQKSSTLYYYYKNNFDDSEIELMISALEAHNYLSAEDISGLVTKLAGLSHGLSEFKNKTYVNATNAPDPRIKNLQAYTLENLSPCLRPLSGGP